MISELIKQKCYFSLNYEKEVNEKFKGNSQKIEYKLPDGSQINIGKQVITCPEAYFNRGLVNKNDQKGIHEIAQESVKSVDVECRRKLYENMIQAGGFAGMSGLQHRFAKEREKLVNNNRIFIEVNLPDTNPYSAWVGAGVLSSLESWKNSWITRKEYEEYGLTYVHRKCF